MSQANENRPPDTAEPVAAGAPGAADAADTDPMAAPLSLEEQLKQALDKAQEREDAWLRAKAETENMRRRAQEDVTKAHKFAVESLASQLLPVRDSLEAALSTGNATLEAFKAGVEITLKQLASVFDKAMLKEINPVGEKFDPHRHQAISMLPSDKEPNTVINVLQKGYLLHDRVVRPALVTVSKVKES